MLTLAIRGSATVPLKEGHAATRSRWSACTLATSDPEEAKRTPGLELMFKAAGDQLEAKLQTYAERLRLPWLSVVTGPKGSYREEHVLAFLERFLEPMAPGRRWRILLMDAYGPQMSDNCRRLAWSRGYVVIIHGGGATGITQPNDTDLHQHLRRDYVALETSDLVKQARLNPGSTPIPRPENCINWMTEVWGSNHPMHLRASTGFKKNGITNALDGSEDHLICRESKYFWDSLKIAEHRLRCIEDVNCEAAANRLDWNFENVYELIVPFPITGHLDTTREFQDDELVVDPDSKEPAWDDGSEQDEGDENEEDVLEENEGTENRDSCSFLSIIN